MAQFLKFKFLIALKLNLNWGQFYKYVNINICFFEKVEKIHIKILKFDVENVEHLR